ncbi:MAG: hypothetical protein ACFCGT_09250 [Sandaracinaceae bacterium]
MEAAPGLGARAAQLAVGVGILYLVGVGLLSVIPALFAPGAPPPATASSCTEGLRALEAELLARAAERMAKAGLQDDAHAPWLASWDLRHRSLGPLCDRGRAWHLLHRLRHRLALTLDRVRAEEGGLVRSLDRALDRRRGDG